MRRGLTGMTAILLLAFGAAWTTAHAGDSGPPTLVETPTLNRSHPTTILPPVAERVPAEPLVTDMAAMGRTPGRHGGDLTTLIGRTKDVRLAVVWGYARLVGWTEDLELKPDILKAVEVSPDGRAITLILREGHRWSDGQPFTSEDFRYYWEDVANNPHLMPSGPPAFFMSDGKLPGFEVISETAVRYSWDTPNPAFLPELAKARPPFIYRPAHYLKRFHERYGDPADLERMIAEARVRNWAALHNRADEMYDFSNVEMPTLQPWMNTTESPAQRYVLVRNPYFHRIDAQGRQLPYIDRLVLMVADGRLIAAKTAAGESDLQARGIGFSNITTLKRGERGGNYRTYLWPISKGSAMALYPNMTVTDPVWRALVRDRRFRHALSLGIDREMLNRVMYFGLGTPANNTALPRSPLSREPYRSDWCRYDTAEANRLLDEIGLTGRRGDGIRLMPDGRPLQIIVETAGESQEQVDMLALIEETWREIGVALFVKSSQRDVMRNRAFAGQLVMSVWDGFDNGIPTPEMVPDELAPVSQAMLAWPEWGQYHETRGTSGEEPDTDWARRLLALYEDWNAATTRQAQAAAWDAMLEIHAEETLTIGTVQGIPQPVAVSNILRNVPETAFYGWDPGAHFGLFRMDTFWRTDAPRSGPESGEAPATQ